MEQFILFGSYCNDVLNKRKPFREVHLNRLSKLKKEGILITLGPTKCNKHVFGIFKGNDIKYIRNLIEEDIYWAEGIWTEFQVYSWTQAF